MRGVAAGTIRNMCASGNIRAAKIGPKLWRIPLAEVRRQWPVLFDDAGNLAA